MNEEPADTGVLHQQDQPGGPTFYLFFFKWAWSCICIKGHVQAQGASATTRLQLLIFLCKGVAPGRPNFLFFFINGRGQVYASYYIGHVQAQGTSATARLQCGST